MEPNTPTETQNKPVKITPPAKVLEKINELVAKGYARSAADFCLMAAIEKIKTIREDESTD